MSSFGIMRSAGSGMFAQSNRLATVADNVANSATTGYKRASTEFSSLLEERTPAAYYARGVMTHVRHAVSEQGNILGTSSATDLAVAGNGFFVVSDASGRTLLTRAGSFVPDAQGRLVNAAGFYLRGYDLSKGTPAAPANQATGLDIVTLPATLQARPTTSGVFAANLPEGAGIVPPANLASANAASAAPSAKSSLIVYSNLGAAVTLDIYFSKTGANSWEMTVFDSANAAAGGGFSYAGGPLATTALTFDPMTGGLAAASAQSLSLAVPGGQTAVLDLSGMKQLASPFEVLSASADGFAPSAAEFITVDKDGTLSAIFKDGTRLPLWKIPLAQVASQDNLTPIAGSAFTTNGSSGDMRISFAGEFGAGNIQSGGLEASTVDLASELTVMIEAQRAYSANGKVFQAGAEVLDIVINMK